MRVTGARPTRRTKAWPASICISLRDAKKHQEAIETAKEPPPVQATAKIAMRHKLRTEAGRSIYKMRKAIVEPVFGQIKEQRGFRRFNLRGLDNVRHEWKMVCLASNLLKLFGSGWTPQAA